MRLSFLSTALILATQTYAEYWMNKVKHQGIASFNPDPSYQVYRNVRDFGAKGDGVTDDTAAIQAAISTGNRCGGKDTCVGSTITPATVFFPGGTYLLSGPIEDYYYTQLIGDPNDMPILKGMPSFPTKALGLIDANPYQSNGKLKYISTNVFFRQIRNFIFDVTDIPHAANGVHWPSSQTTSIQNCIFNMSKNPADQHTGIFMESGSGGYLGDLVFYGGQYGARLGNQQYTTRNLTFYGSETAILQLWNWAWTYKDIHVHDASIGVNMTASSVGSATLIDSTFENVGTAIWTARNPAEQENPGAGALVVENLAYQNTKKVIAGIDKTIVSGGAGKNVVQSYIFGNIYTPDGPNVVSLENDEYFPRPASLLDGNEYYARSKPQYEDKPASLFLSARTLGAVGDGKTDDTVALNRLFKQAASQFDSGAVAFLDAGYYLVTDTIFIPPSVRIVGEALASVILGTGPAFSDIDKPYPVVQVGLPGVTGYIEWSDTIVSTRGATAGAVLIQYNLDTPVGSGCHDSPPSGMWDVHARIGGFVGSNLQVEQCPKTPEKTNPVPPECICGYLTMHVTSSASNLYMENNWLWVADHDMDDWNNTQVSLFAGRGLHIAAKKGPFWLFASSVEHHTVYQYELVNTQDIFMGMIQTETPYYQPNPPAPYPFVNRDTSLWDPNFSLNCPDSINTGSALRRGTDLGIDISPSSKEESLPGNPACKMAWGLIILGSKNIKIMGAGLYSFFNNYNLECSNEGNGEHCQARILFVGQTPSVSGSPAVPAENVFVYDLSTIGVVSMINRDRKDIALFEPNIAGFTDIVALFKY